MSPEKNKKTKNKTKPNRKTDKDIPFMWISFMEWDIYYSSSMEEVCTVSVLMNEGTVRLATFKADLLPPQVQPPVARLLF